jgi:hypothetical protein
VPLLCRTADISCAEANCVSLIALEASGDGDDEEFLKDDDVDAASSLGDGFKPRLLSVRPNILLPFFFRFSTMSAIFDCFELAGASFDKIFFSKDFFFCRFDFLLLNCCPTERTICPRCVHAKL